MCNSSFVKGMGIGLLVGSAIGMTACGSGSSSRSCRKRKNLVGKVLRAMGEVAESVGDAFGL